MHLRALAASAAVVAICAAPFLSAAPARADDSPDAATAEALFADARRLMQETNYPAACPKLAASYKIDTALGNPALGTILNLALCHERNGQVATAWIEYQDAAVAADRRGEGERAAFALRRAELLEPTLPRILVRAPRRAPGVRLTRDGVPIDDAALETAVPVDPGAHVIAASGPGYAPWSTSVEARVGGGTVAVDVPALARLGAEAEAEGADAPGPAASAPRGGDAPAAGAARPRRRAVALALGGAGVVGLAIGAGFGISAIRSWSTAKNDHCRGSQCDADGLRLTGDAKRAATASTIAFAAGGVALAGGIVLWLTAPRAGVPAAIRWTPGRRGGELGLSVAMP